MVKYACISSAWENETDRLEFEAMLGYIMRLSRKGNILNKIYYWGKMNKNNLGSYIKIYIQVYKIQVHKNVFENCGV